MLENGIDFEKQTDSVLDYVVRAAWGLTLGTGVGELSLMAPGIQARLKSLASEHSIADLLLTTALIGVAMGFTPGAEGLKNRTAAQLFEMELAARMTIEYLSQRETWRLALDKVTHPLHYLPHV